MLLTLQYCIGFAIHQHESATGLEPAGEQTFDVKALMLKMIYVRKEVINLSFLENSQPLENLIYSCIT